ncbi:hypothetical protein C2S51_034692 [Perilla frutescens var. frutescens]|nr:hypothetical protein C2S51_034692 [Perilla frutescens var. frutescens]
MASSTIRKAIGVVKDQTSISLAKVAGNAAPDLEVLVVKATTHDNGAADDKYAKEILNLMSHSRGYVSACVSAVSKRLSKTSDWIVALKALMLMHKLLNEGGAVFRQEVMFASRRGARVLNMADFRDDSHPNSWDHSAFVRAYALCLDQKLEHVAYYGRKVSVGGDDDDDGGPERVLERLNQLLRLLDRFLACRPTGAARDTRVVLVAVCLLVRDSFGLYGEICDVLGYLLGCFVELGYECSVKAFDAYVDASKMIDGLNGFYGWVKEVGLVRSSEFPEVQRISDHLLGSLEGLLREKGNSFSHIKDEREAHHTSSHLQQKVQNQELVDLKGEGVSSANEEGEKLALALFSAPAASSGWVEFSSDGETARVSSEGGRADWEVALMESSTNHLSMQRAELGGGLDPLLLDGMYDQGTVRQHVRASEMSGGSASSVALPGMSRATARVLALPAPDGTVQPVGGQDPFAASLLVAPPSYVQMADMERKQRLLVHEQQLWQQYATTGMQGQLALAKISGGAGGYCDASLPYGMPQQGGMGYSYYYTSY